MLYIWIGVCSVLIIAKIESLERNVKNIEKHLKVIVHKLDPSEETKEDTEEERKGID